MKNENKKVEFKAPIKPTEDVSKQTTQIDEIMLSEANTGNQKKLFWNMMKRIKQQELLKK